MRPKLKTKMKTMKKLILSLAIVAIASLSASAQAKFGIKAAMNISSLRGDDADGLKSYIGANGGLFANIPLTGNLSVQPEVLYSAEGAKAEDGDGKIQLGYVNIPVMLKYTDASGFFGEVGPQIGILTSAKLKVGDNSEDIKDGFKSTNLSVGVGAGFNFTPSIGVGLRYNLGLSNISDNDDADVKTGNFSIGVHYTFGSSK